MADNAKEEVVKTYDPKTLEEYKNSAYYQSLGIDKLESQLGGYQTDMNSLRQQAETLYKPTYEAEIEAIRQQAAQQAQAYEGQLEGIGLTYDKQRRLTDQSYNESAVNLNNALTKRGLGRSSLVSTQGAYLENQRNQALSDLAAQEASDIKAINDRVALLKDQAAQSERRLAGSYAQQIEARMIELRQQNQSAATSLQLQIAALQQQGYQAYQQWLLAEREMQLAEDQFEYQKSKKSSSSSSSKSSSGTQNTYTPPANNGIDLDGLIDRLMGSDAGKAVSAGANAVSNTLSGISNGVKNVGSAISNLFDFSGGNKEKTNSQKSTGRNNLISKKTTK